MSITINTIPSLSPVYTDGLKLIATESDDQELEYFNFEIYVENSLLDTFIYFANPVDKTATIDLSPILSTYFTSKVYTPTGTTMYEEIPDSIVNYYIEITSYTALDSQINNFTSNDFDVFNGCFNNSDDYTISDFIISSLDKGNFLTNWSTPRELRLDGTAYVNYISGNYGVGLFSDFGGLNINTLSKSGYESSQPFFYTNTNKTIINMDVSPTMINATYPNFINEDTVWYEIREINFNQKTPMRINLIDERKITKFYNFQYVNHVGGIDFFTASKVSNTELDIDRMILDQFTTQKQYYTTVEEEITVLTQPLTAEQSDGLKGLFISPSVQVTINDVVSDVTILNSKMVVVDRYPKTSLIQYQIKFKFNNKYYNQNY